VAKTRGDLQSETGINKRTVRESIARIQGQELIEVRFWRFGSRNMNHYRINVEKVAEVMPGVIAMLAPEVTKVGKSGCHGTSPGDDSGRQFDLTSNVRSITKSTTKNTAEKTINTQAKPIENREIPLESDVYADFEKFCQEFSCTPSVLLKELRKLSSQDQFSALKVARQKINDYDRPIENFGGFAFSPIQKTVASFLSGDKDCLDARGINKEVNALIEGLGWSNGQRASVLFERYRVHAFSDLSLKQKLDFCAYLSNMVLNFSS
jgi:hypothetical protein